MPPVEGSTYSEADWNKTSTVAKGEAYWVSKVQAELAAWEAAKQAGVDLVTILPGERAIGLVLWQGSTGSILLHVRRGRSGKFGSGSGSFR